jgi:hypothetical protein
MLPKLDHPQPFGILQGHYSNQMVGTTIGTNNPSHEDESLRMSP